MLRSRGPHRTPAETRLPLQVFLFSSHRPNDLADFVTIRTDAGSNITGGRSVCSFHEPQRCPNLTGQNSPCLAVTPGHYLLGRKQTAGAGKSSATDLSHWTVLLPGQVGLHASPVAAAAPDAALS